MTQPMSQANNATINLNMIALGQSHNNSGTNYMLKIKMEHLRCLTSLCYGLGYGLGYNAPFNLNMIALGQ